MNVAATKFENIKKLSWFFAGIAYVLLPHCQRTSPTQNSSVSPMETSTVVAVDTTVPGDSPARTSTVDVAVDVPPTNSLLDSGIVPTGIDVFDVLPGIPTIDAAVMQDGTVFDADVTVVALNWTGFLGGNDDELLHRVCNSSVERLERNRGGTTISFRATMGGGLRGLFKPQQTASVASFRAEIAAYRLSRALGLHRVPVACGRIMQQSVLQTAADRSGDAEFAERAMRELLGRNGNTPGAMLYWVPGPLENVPGTARWQELLNINQAIVPSDAALSADLSLLILWDYIIDNVDRWSGGNILRQHLRGMDPGPMLFMDNGASFTAGEDGRGARPREQTERLQAVQRFSRSFVSALRSLTDVQLRAAMGEDPLSPLLSDSQLRAVLQRKDRVVAHVDEMIRTHGEERVMVFP